ncbi:hypothetical protein ACFQL7_20680 [Halocatena marina]|uniref:Uncharacterized protein n=1 Tax=Halocatena marina TaxID=2934937 RepID=A0ABD5YRC8_9EURY|nr:hypothetical protein [Halocatena marina]
MSEELSEKVVEEIESKPGLKTALQMIGHAAMKAQDEGRCVLSFESVSGDFKVLEITDHVATLEDKK